MPTILPYDFITQVLSGKDFKGLYPGGGSFGFLPGCVTYTVGWMGLPDPTIRPEALLLTRAVPAPYAENLVALTLNVWREWLTGPVWVLPRSHWAYELDFGSKTWLPAALSNFGINESQRAGLSKGEAIEFQPEDRDPFGNFLRILLDNLSGSSDFQLIWPDNRVLCLVHHHQQLWWTTADESLHQKLTSVSG